MIRIGEVISGKFQVESVIAQGGMGVVYEGTHLHLKRKVALKVLHPHLVAKDSMTRLRREAVVLAKMTNPHSAQVHDFGIHRGMPYIAMELIDGTELADVLVEQGFLPLPRVVNIVDQVLDVLSSAHLLGIVHRDLKPANLMLCKTESAGEDFVKVVDFGIAFLRDQDEPRVTKQGQVHGTAAYMSPEQCRGLEVDARSDLYSLGCVMYELISGSPPFVSDGSIEVLSAHLYRQPLSLREAFPEREVPAAMDAFVLRALSKQREARFSSADEMRKELARAHTESGLRAARPPRTPVASQAFESLLGDADLPPIALLELEVDLASRDMLLTTLGASAVRSVRVQEEDSLMGYGLVMVLAHNAQQALTVCKKLLEAPHVPPVVLCGPEDDLELMTTSIGIGIHDYIPLPLEPVDVARKVLRILRRHGKAVS